MSQGNAPLVLMMAGGTGGHVFPALETAKALQMQGYAIQWLGTATRIEAEIVPEAGIKLHCLSVRGIRGKALLGKVKGAVALLLALGQAIWLIKQLKPALVIGMGGFAAGPGGIAAWLCRVPLLIHEQNTIPGVTNKILARFAKRVLTGFPNVLVQQGGIYVGNPIRQEIASIIPPVERYSQRDGPMRILVIGGSLGARTLNELLPQVLGNLLGQNQEKLVVRHQTGKENVIAVQQAYNAVNISADVQPFIKNIAEAYTWADLVICRSGALTVAEVAAVGVAALFVPFPYAVDDHQRKNAEALVSAGGARLIAESELSVMSLFEILSNLCQSRTYLLEMAEKARQCSRPQATENVVCACVEMINEQSNQRK
ncbi:undecaprenyldiphospho-muramoylpentapeptide beta-N-acetylglucosaminyltransferase [Piscirickettsia salmonis]|nr:undecaprenyldiphospho-muramoylpentapeptide beta-N-acetylglucosaminyltransferase [Piscirickettsia salmonis]QGN93466.1 undecaprenyldiphospho-muramoylpentapeptide beta-N-acetylglucosaminyltransferase [Piscirickettsia salmonis]